MPTCASCGAELPPNAAFCRLPAVPRVTAPVAVARPAAVAVTDVKAWAMWSHLSALGGLVFPFGNILGPLIIWLSKREEIPEVDVNAKEAMNFQITMSAVSIGLWVASIVLTLLHGFSAERCRRDSRGVHRRRRNPRVARGGRRLDHVRDAGIHRRT